jgi:hypothetical protein
MEVIMRHFMKRKWSEISDQLRKLKVDQNVFRVLNSLSTKIKNPVVIEGIYEYGYDIVNNGVLVFPCQNVSCENCSKIHNDHLMYSQIPLGIVIENSVEVCSKIDECISHKNGEIETEPREIVLRLLSTTEMFGSFEIMDKLFIPKEKITPARWNLHAGSKNIIILYRFNEANVRKMKRDIESNINMDTESHEKGQKESFQVDWDRYNNDNWEFVKYYNSKLPEDKKWAVRILFFPEQWIWGDLKEHLQLRDIICSTGWNQAAPMTNYLNEEINIREIYSFNKLKNFKAFPYYFSLHRNLVLASRGEVPAFVPILSLKNASLPPAGPLFEVEKILVESNLKSNDYPGIFQPFHLNHEIKYGYISLKTPNIHGPVTELRTFKNDVAEIFCRVFTFLREASFKKIPKEKSMQLKLFDVPEIQFFCKPGPPPRKPAPDTPGYNKDMIKSIAKFPLYEVIPPEAFNKTIDEKTTSSRLPFGRHNFFSAFARIQK